MNESDNHWEPAPSDLERAVEEAPRLGEYLIGQAKEIDRFISKKISHANAHEILKESIDRQRESYLIICACEDRYNKDESYKAICQKDEIIRAYHKIYYASKRKAKEAERVLRYQDKKKKGL